MPYEWSPAPPYKPTQDWTLTLWPYRSLLKRDFVIFIGSTAALVSLPLIALLGTAVLWVLLPFFALAMWGLWFAISISYRRGELIETLTATGAEIHLTRHDPKAKPKTWRANRYWAKAELYPTQGPVKNYVTLSGADREVELGAFLDETERLTLYSELRQALQN